jgi:hypothetical protein
MRINFLIATLLLSSVSTLGQATSSQVITNTSQPATLGSIKGRVVNEGGRPLPNAIVAAIKFNANRADSTAVTDRDGNFELTGLEPASYRLYARLVAYTPLLSDTDNAVDNQYRVGESVTLVLTKGGVITGTVRNETGEPVEGARVRASLVRDTRRLPWPYGFLGTEQTTDDRGVYRIYGLAAGTYVVRAGGPGEVQNEANPFETDVPTYAPSSNRDGAEEISVRAGEETSNVDIRYRGGKGHVISGSASGPKGVETRGFGVFLTPAKDASWAMTPYQTAPDGKHFVLERIDDGAYDISAVSARETGEWLLSPSKRITVRGADVTGIELIAQPVSSVSGRVVLDETKIPECSDTRRPLFSEMTVSALKNEKEVSAYPSLVFLPISSTTSVDAQGNVLLRNVLPGRYYFGAQFAGKYWYLQSISLPPSGSGTNSKPIDAARTWTTLNAGNQLSGLTVTLAHGAASFRGQVAGEAPSKNLFVYFIPQEKDKADDVLRFYAASVSTDGKVALNHLAPGRYRVLVQEAADGTPSKLRMPDETQTRAKLRRDAEAANTEIEFKPCQNVVDYRLKM